MPYSYTLYTGNGSNTDFVFSFPYLSQSHVKVYLNGVLQASGYSFVTSTGPIRFTAAPADGVSVKIQRETPLGVGDRPVVFENGAGINEDDLNTAFLQNLYSQQEIEDRRAQTLRGSFFDGSLSELPSAASRASKLLGFGADGDPEVVDKQELIDEVGSGAVAQAAASASAAESAKNTATNQAADATAAKNAAETAKTAAEAAQTAAEDAQVAAEEAAVAAAAAGGDGAFGLWATGPLSYYNTTPTGWRNTAIMMTFNGATAPAFTVQVTGGATHVRMYRWDGTLATVVAVSGSTAITAANWGTAPASPYNALIPKFGAVFACNSSGVVTGSITHFTAQIQTLTSLHVCDPASLVVLNVNFNALGALYLGKISSMAALLSLNISAIGLTTLPDFTGFVGQSIDLRNNYLSKAALDGMFNQLPTAPNSSYTVFVGANPGTATADTSIATAKGWTVNTA